jgi:hypothetical protein
MLGIRIAGFLVLLHALREEPSCEGYCYHSSPRISRIISVPNLVKFNFFIDLSITFTLSNQSKQSLKCHYPFTTFTKHSIQKD